jgi:hypothetical protein
MADYFAGHVIERVRIPEEDHRLLERWARTRGRDVSAVLADLAAEAAAAIAGTKREAPLSMDQVRAREAEAAELLERRRLEAEEARLEREAEAAEERRLLREERLARLAPPAPSPAQQSRAVTVRRTLEVLARCEVMAVATPGPAAAPEPATPPRPKPAPSPAPAASVRPVELPPLAREEVPPPSPGRTRSYVRVGHRAVELHALLQAGYSKTQVAAAWGCSTASLNNVVRQDDYPSP